MRLDITRKSDLALRALRVLAAEPTVWKAPDLAARIGTTRGFLGQVLAPLVREGWVMSAVGPSGGYHCGAVARPPTMLQVIEAIEGPTLDDRCVLRDGSVCARMSGDRELCALHDGWFRARDALMAALARTPCLDAEAARVVVPIGSAGRLRMP